jgi:hypothetical protein
VRPLVREFRAGSMVASAEVWGKGIVVPGDGKPRRKKRP